MIITLSNNMPVITDQYTGVITSGGSMQILSDKPLTDTSGNYVELAMTSPNFVYAWRGIGPQDAAAIASSHQLIYSFLMRVEQFPTLGAFDIARLRNASHTAMFLQFVPVGSQWQLKLYSRNDDNTTVSAATEAEDADWWVDYPLLISTTVDLRNGATLGSATLAVIDPSSQETQDSAALSNLDNAVQYGSLNQMEMGSSANVSATAIWDFDEVTLQSTASGGGIHPALSGGGATNQKPRARWGDQLRHSAMGPVPGMTW